MNFPYKIHLVNFIPLNSLKGKIENKLIKLSLIKNDISSCRIILELHYDRDLKNHFYEVKINLTMANKVVVTNRYSNTLGKDEDIHVAIWRAFSAIRQQLEFYRKSESHKEVDTLKVTALSKGIKLRLRGVT